MAGFLTLVLVIVSIVIVFVVIMQPSKDGGLGGLSGGGVTDSVFGAGRNEFLSKATWWLMAIFLISSIALAKHETNARIAKESKINKKSVAEEIDISEKSSTEEDKLKSLSGEATDKVEEKKEEATTTKVETAVDKLKKEPEANKENATNVEAPKAELPKIDVPASK